MKSISFKEISLIFLSRYWSLLALVLILAFFEIYSQSIIGQTFLFRAFNINAIGVATAQILLMSLGLTLVIVSGRIDLSIAFITGLAAIAMAVTVRWTDPVMTSWLSLVVGLVIGLFAAIVIGLLNGWMVAWLSVPSFIGTLGTYSIARGAALLIGNGNNVAVINPTVVTIGNGSFLGVSLPIWYAIIASLIFHYILKHTRFGLRVYALGSNEDAPLRAGVNVKRTVLILFVLSAIGAGLSGLLYTGRFSAGAANAGQPILLYAVAAVFIGGASLTGGQGSIFGTVIGSIIIATIQFGLVYLGLPPYWQFVSVGLVIILAVLIDQWQTHFGVMKTL